MFGQDKMTDSRHFILLLHITGLKSYHWTQFHITLPTGAVHLVNNGFKSDQTTAG